MDWGTIGAIAGIIAIIIAAFQALIAWLEYMNSQKVRSMAPDELRVLRALVTEVHGRHLHNYKNSNLYSPALRTLIKEEFIRQAGDLYYLTDKGEKAVKKHLAEFLKKKRW